MLCMCVCVRACVRAFECLFRLCFCCFSFVVRFYLLSHIVFSLTAKRWVTYMTTFPVMPYADSIHFMSECHGCLFYSLLVYAFIDTISCAFNLSISFKKLLNPRSMLLNASLYPLKIFANMFIRCYFFYLCLTFI